MSKGFQPIEYTNKAINDLKLAGLEFKIFNGTQHIKISKFNWFPSTGTVTKDNDSEFYNVASDVKELLEIIKPVH